MVTQQGEIERLQSELADWKGRLAKLHEQLDEGAIDEEQLKRELTLGITAVCEHNYDGMTAVQELLRDCSSQIDENTMVLEPQKVIGLLAAKVELLEGQTDYWQDLVISNRQASMEQANQAPLEFGAAEQPSHYTIKLSDKAPTDNPAANADEASLSNARNSIAEKTKRARGPKQSKRKRRNKRKQLRTKKPAAKLEVISNDGDDDARVVSQQA